MARRSAGAELGSQALGGLAREAFHAAVQPPDYRHSRVFTKLEFDLDLFESILGLQYSVCALSELIHIE